MFHLIFQLIALLILTQNAFASHPTEWNKLMHYQLKGHTFSSLIENQSYFLTPNGKFDPTAEYNAHIKAFNTPNDTTKCTFPARFLYLKSQNLVQGDLSSCTEYQQYLQDLQPKAMTMLFTNAYMSNPSSLFGRNLACKVW